MKIGFLSFAGGDILWKLASLRIEKQAIHSNEFEAVKVYSPEELSKISKTSDLNFMHSNKRGYGYWLWKPILVLDFIQKHPDVDVILYTDAGCDLNFNTKSRKNWQKYLNKLHEFECVVFKMELIEKNWTKRELIDAFPIFKEHAASEQILGGVFLMKRNFAIEFCNQWLANMRTDNYALLDDSLNPKIQDPEFSSHRHDQSFFSLMCKSDHRVLILDSLKEVYFEPTWSDGDEYPIWTSRNKSYLAKYKTGNLYKFLRDFERLLKKLVV